MICRNPSEWKVSTNRFGGKTWYAVYRIRDIDQVDHRGNREFVAGYIEDRQEAEDLAEFMNMEDRNG